MYLSLPSISIKANYTLQTYIIHFRIFATPTEHYEKISSIWVCKRGVAEWRSRLNLVARRDNFSPLFKSYTGVYQVEAPNVFKRPELVGPAKYADFFAGVKIKNAMKISAFWLGFTWGVVVVTGVHKFPLVVVKFVLPKLVGGALIVESPPEQDQRVDRFTVCKRCEDPFLRGTFRLWNVSNL